MLPGFDILEVLSLFLWEFLGGLHLQLYSVALWPFMLVTSFMVLT